MRINLATEKGIQKLKMELDIVQEKSKVRTITADQVLAAAEMIFEKIHISKKALNGSKFSVDLNARNMLYIYDSIPQSTIFDLEYCNGHWVVTNICRGHTHRTGHNVESWLTYDAKKGIADRFSHFAIDLAKQE